jgi:dynein heavy chain
MPENITLIRAMCDSNLPKFLKDDVILFHAIVQDLFPGVEVPKQDTGQLYSEIVSILQEKFLVVNEDIMAKAIQLYEVLGIRFGMMVVGPTGSGKTTTNRALAEAMTRLREKGHEDQAFQITHTLCFNPKSISMGELYGNYNLMTNEWTDGLGSTIIRTANNDTSNDKQFITFDGPIDAIWIENMNTVLKIPKIHKENKGLNKIKAHKNKFLLVFNRCSMTTARCAFLTASASSLMVSVGLVAYLANVSVFICPACASGPCSMRGVSQE